MSPDIKALLIDAFGNPLLGLNDSIQNETLLSDSRAATVTLNGAGQEASIDINSKGTIGVDLRSAAFVGTVVFEGMLDGTNYYSDQIPVFVPSTGLFVSSIVGAGAVVGARYLIRCAGYRRVRVRVSTYTSGDITVAMRGNAAVSTVMATGIPAIPISATGAANAAVTLTIPAPAAGLFNYITGLEITRNATAAVAGTATLVVTTTNLPGSLAWSVGNAIAAGGTQIDVARDFKNPIRSSAAGTATTIVAPAPGLTALWRINAYYYQAP